MTTTVVPPQAYTKADLSKAYQWLIKQPEAIQLMATTPDTLVGLYRKALLYGASSITSQNSTSTSEFKLELKDLAGKITDFDTPKPATNTQTAYSSSVSYQASKGLPPWAESQTLMNLQNTAPTQTEQRPISYAAPQIPKEPEMQMPQNPWQAPVAETQQQNIPIPKLSNETKENISANIEAVHSQIPSQTPPAPSKSMISQSNIDYGESIGLDANSRAMVGEIRRRMNLSSDAEAVRMMISIGYEQLKKLF